MFFWPDGWLVYGFQSTLTPPVYRMHRIPYVLLKKKGWIPSELTKNSSHIAILEGQEFEYFGEWFGIHFVWLRYLFVCGCQRCQTTWQHCGALKLGKALHWGGMSSPFLDDSIRHHIYRTCIYNIHAMLKHFERKMQRPVMPVCVTWTLEFKNESMQQLIDIRSQYSTGFLPSLHTHSIRHCHLTKATYSIHFSFQLQFLCFKHRWDPNHLWNHGWKLVLFVGQDGLGRCEHNTWGRWLGFVSFLRRKARFFGKLAVCY